MSKITAADIVADVRTVISTAFHGQRKTPSFVTAIQIENRLPTATRSKLVADHGDSGKDSGNYYPASQVVKDALLMLARDGEVAIDYLDANNEISIDTPNGPVKPGNVTVAIYRFIG